MKRLGILTFLALSLLVVVPVQAADNAAAPVVLTVMEEAAELASLEAGEVIYTSSTSSFCQFCPSYPEDCLDLSQDGMSCSDPGMNCSCGFCGGEFGCFFN